MMQHNRIAQMIRRWRADEDGSIAVETLMMVPLMVWAFLSTLIYFDAYRTEGTAIKAGLTIADMFSREDYYIDNKYMNGAQDLLQFLTLHDDNPRLRVTVFKWHRHSENSGGHYHRVWSKVRGSTAEAPLAALTTADIRAMADERLPVMSNEERAILVETWTTYDVRYNVMFVQPLQDFEVETFTVISPRFTSRLCWTPDSDADDAADREVC